MGEIGYFFNIIFTYPIFNILMLLDHLFGDLGLSIIVLTLIIRLLLFPLTLKQLKSTKATQAIQPLMADIRKKYAKDQRAQYEAMQALYKEYGVNPAAGCLPLVIQLPVLYGLFYALNTTLRNPVLTNSAGTGINNLIYPFLPHFSVLPDIHLRWLQIFNPAWVINLGVADPSHILPVLAGLATFIQLRMSQPRSTAGSKDAMTQQMQIMQFVMPFITFFFALNFPAGLALYWTTTSLFSMVQQYFVTGWGSLTTLPSFLGGGTFGGKRDSRDSNSNKTYNGDARKERQILQRADEPVAEVAGESGPIGRKLQASDYSNGPASRRRQRGGSASARRRGNAPRRNPSRSQ